MKWKKITAAVGLAAACASAQALERNPDGLGQAQLLPYYSVHRGESTLVSVVNHADEAKAVRVVIAEGDHGRAALHLNLYLGPRDRWSGALSATSALEEAAPVLVSNDASCTSVAIGPAGLALSDDAFTGERADGLGADPIRLHQGQVEVVELGVLTGTTAALVAPGNCAALRARFASGGAWAVDPNADVGAPTGGLSAAANIVDVEAGVIHDVPSIAFDDFSGAARHSFDDAGVRIFRPTLAPGQTEFVVDGVTRFPPNRAPDAVSLALMAAHWEGEFLIDGALDASTRWVVGFPTRAAYVDNLPGGELPLGTPVLPPFAGTSAIVSNTAVCREGHVSVFDDAGTLGAQQVVPLCFQVSEFPLAAGALPIGKTTPDPMRIGTGGIESGRVRMGVNATHGMNVTSVSGTTTVVRGLPMAGVALTRALNANAQPGRLAAYAMSRPLLRVD